MRTALAVILLAGLAAPALASEGLLVATKGQTKINVWRSAKAHEEGEALLHARADTALIAPLMACVADPGTRVIIIGPRVYSTSVTVIDGSVKGCRGFVAKENFKWKE